MVGSSLSFPILGDNCPTHKPRNHHSVLHHPQSILSALPPKGVLTGPRACPPGSARLPPPCCPALAHRAVGDLLSPRVPPRGPPAQSSYRNHFSASLPPFSQVKHHLPGELPRALQSSPQAPLQPPTMSVLLLETVFHLQRGSQPTRHQSPGSMRPQLRGSEQTPE